MHAHDAPASARCRGSQVGVTMVGDSVVDWQTARAAGTRVCLVRYGFGFQGFPTAELTPEDQLVDEASALTTLL